jgi:site-specific recombinase XerD
MSWLPEGVQDGPLIVSRPGTKGRGNGLSKVQLWKMVHLWAKRCGIRDFRFHDLRHTFATFAMVADNSNLRVVQDLLRHRSVTSTQIYLHPTHAQLQHVIENAFNEATEKTDG